MIITHLKQILSLTAKGLKISGDITEKNQINPAEKINVTAVGTTDGDQSFDIEFKDIKTENKDKGYCSGEINLNLSALDMGNIAVNLSSDGKSQEISTEINVGGTKYANVTLKYSDNKPEGIPAFNGAEKVYNYSSDGSRASAVYCRSGYGRLPEGNQRCYRNRSQFFDEWIQRYCYKTDSSYKT